MQIWSVTLDDLTAELVRAHPEIRWSEVVREAFRRKLKELGAAA